MGRSKLDIVTRPEQVISNIATYTKELRANAELQARVGYARAWYAVQNQSGKWSFAPSKFVGYRENTARKYFQIAEIDADGRESERALAHWFRVVEDGHRLHSELVAALRDFLAPYGSPNSRARISIEASEIAVAGEGDGSLKERIVSTPDVCGGRPRIKGTRMRVSDILDMLASGASREEILQDFAYVAGEDIDAALAYAARATSHRLIRAA